MSCSVRVELNYWILLPGFDVYQQLTANFFSIQFNVNRPHSIAISQIAGIDLKALEEAADEAEKELAARRSQAYSTQYSQFFDQLGFDRRKEDGRDEDKEKGFVKRNLPYRVQEDLIRIFEVYFEGHTHFEERQREEYDSRFRRLLRSINGTMPWIQEYILEGMPCAKFFLFVDACLRGIGQVVFMNNPLVGLLILAGLFLQSTRVAVHGLIGVLSGTLIAYVLGFDTGLKRSGLFGYNSLLTGLAMATFFSASKNHGYDAAVAINTIVFSCFSSIVFVFLGKILVPYKSPPFTLPFNISVIMYLLSTAYSTRVNTGAVREPSLPDYYTYDNENIDTTITAAGFFAGSVRGVGQIFLADNIGSGLFVIAGMAVCSRISALAAWAGSALGAAVALAIGVPGALIEKGMYGFNPSLTFVAVYGMFYSPTLSSFAFAVMASIMTVLSQQAFATILEPWGLPFMTLPFCACCLIFVLVQGSTSLVVAVPLANITVPEDHLKKHQYLTEGFQFLKEALYPENSEDFRKSRSAGPSRLGQRGGKINRSMRVISTLIDDEDDNFEEDVSSVNSSRRSERSIARSFGASVSISSHRHKQLNKFKKQTMDAKAKWVLKAAPRIFKALDVKKEGSIYIQDFTSALRTVGLNDKNGLRFASLVFDIMDTDMSNSIEKKEWVIFCLVSIELSAVRKKISKFFDFVDADASEIIDFDELDAALAYLGEPLLTEADHETLLSVLTVDDEEEGIDIIELINFTTIAKIKQMMNVYVQEHTASMRSIEVGAGVALAQ